MKTLKVGMLGCGVVGLQIARLLINNKADLSSRAGANLELVKIFILSLIGKAQDATGLITPTTSTRHILQLPAIDNFS